MPSWLLADMIVIVHFAFFLVVVLTVPVVLIGWYCRWQWVHNSWYRNIHLLMIASVVLEAAFDIRCPLTAWEENLRSAAGQEALQTGSFIGHWLHELLFVEFEMWILNTVYTLFGVIVVVLYFAVPPRWMHRYKSARKSS